MHLHKLIYQFKMLIECKTFTAASDLLHISQPTLSQNIKRLEQALGTPLLVRSNRGISKTVYGESLYKHACLLDKSYKQALNEIKSIKYQQRKTLTLECGYGWSHGQLVTLLQDYIEQHPQIKIIIRNNNSLNCQERLLRGECDIALGRIPTSENQEKGIHYTSIVETKFSLFCSQKHPFANLTQITNEQLNHSDWIILRHTNEESGYQDPYIYPFEENSVRFEVHSMTSAIDLLSVSQCLMALPELLYDEATHKGLVKLNTEFECPKYNTGIMYTDDALLQAHKERMINAILRSQIPRPEVPEPARPDTSVI